MKSPLRASLFTLAFTSYSALALANPAPATPAAPAAAPAAPVAAAPTPVVAAAPAPAPAPGVDFTRDVQPIFENKCLECHNPNKIKGKLLMDSAVALLKGGDTGPGLVAGKPDESEIIKRVVLPKDHDDIMPPKADRLPRTK
jgi:mono/diheme cytochrome c family protein